MKRIFAFLCLTLFSLSSVADEAHFHEGYQLIRAKQFKAAISVLTPLAEQGHADAQYWLGLSYRLGRPDQDFSDMESELHWYREAAQNNQPYALWRLGRGEYLTCQLLGACEHKNKKLVEKAKEIWRQRAAQGDSEAMYQVGVRALGWKQWIPYYNLYSRSEWMKKAIQHGYLEAAEDLYYMLEDLGSNEQEKITWLRIAAEKGDPWAQTMMGSLASSSEERLNWMRKAAAQNYSEGIFALGYSYRKGEDVEKDLTKAAFYYCLLSYNSTARMICSDLSKELPEQKQEQVSAQVTEWLENNTIYYFTHPLFD